MGNDFAGLSAIDFSKKFTSKRRFKKEWMKEVKKLFHVDSEEELIEILETQFNNREVRIHNTVRGREYITDSIELLHRAYSTPYNLFENGIMFVSQEKELPPAVEGQMELYDTRREIKDEAIYYLTEGNNPKLGKLKDRQQQLLKLIMN